MWSKSWEAQYNHINWGILLSQTIFLFTGVFSTCAAQFINYQGAGNQKAMLLPLFNYLGMMLVGFLPVKLPAQEDTTTTGLATSMNKKIPTSPLVSNDGDNASFSAVERRANTTLMTHPPTMAVTASSSSNPHTHPQLTYRDKTDSSSSLTSAEKLRLLPNEDLRDDPMDTTLAITTSTLTSFSLPPMLLRLVSPTVAAVVCSKLNVFILCNVVCDLTGCIFSNIGLSMTGSGIFQVMYSSVVCWSALFSRLIFNTFLNQRQLSGIATLTLGLALSALGEGDTSSESRRLTLHTHIHPNTTSHTLMLAGSIYTLLGAGCYGATYVCGEFLLKLPQRPNARILCMRIGASCLVFLTPYLLLVVLPNWQALLRDPIHAAQGNPTLILLVLMAYTLSQTAHAMTYFIMLDKMGAVTTGVLQSLRAVSVFAASAVLFCEQQESQCYNTHRGVATGVVVLGVLGYSIATGQRRIARVATLRRFSDEEVMVV